MKAHAVYSLIAASLFVAAGSIAHAQEETPPAAKAPSAEDIAAMMKRAQRFTQPGKMHKVLQRFIGEWNTETRLVMGGKSLPAEKGTAKTSWLMEGRWIKSEWSGPFLGKPMQGYSLMGYDNFKHSFVVSTVTSMDTAMNCAEGDLDPRGKVLLLYGTVDEYLTGEHDKMVKTVWRFVSEDKLVMEVHDLPIGERNTKVIEVTFTRK